MMLSYIIHSLVSFGIMCPHNPTQSQLVHGMFPKQLEFYLSTSFGLAARVRGATPRRQEWRPMPLWHFFGRMELIVPGRGGVLFQDVRGHARDFSPNVASLFPWALFGVISSLVQVQQQS